MELKLTKEQLYDRNGILDGMIEALPNPAILVDAKGRVLYASQQARGTWRKDGENPINSPIRSEDSRRIVEYALKTGQSQLDKVAEIGGRKVLTNTIPIKENGVVIGALCTLTIQDIASLKDVVAKLGKTQQDRKMYHTLSRTVSRYRFEDFLGESDAAKRVIEQCRLAAQSEYSILIIGETGCGKEILSSAIHTERTPFQPKPFVKINCTAIPDNLIESELFGYEKGAFTGASSAKPGKFELAEDGTILLDEIGDMNLSLQSKLLRVLEEREFERVGGDKVYPLQANVIATTNRDLAALAAEDKFRMDLYYRLATIEIHIPALRERREDIPLLLNYFIGKFQADITLDKDAMEYLMSYSWPGNVRQLRHLVIRLSVLYRGKQITRQILEEYFRINKSEKSPSLMERTLASRISYEEPDPGDYTLEAVERNHIRKRLEANGGNIAKTAAELGIARNTLYNKMKKYHIEF